METLSIEFFHVFSWMWPQARGRVCSLQLTFERQEGRPAVSDLQQGFFSITVQRTQPGPPNINQLITGHVYNKGVWFW